MEVNSVTCCPRPNRSFQKSQATSFGYIKLPTTSTTKGFTGNKEMSDQELLQKKYDLACRYIAVQNQVIHNLQDKK